MGDQHGRCDSADVRRAVGAHEGQSAKDIRDALDELANTDHAKCLEASGKLCSVLAAYTGLEALTNARSVTSCEGKRDGILRGRGGEEEEGGGTSLQTAK